MSTTFSNSSDVIDSRDVITRIDELTDEIDAWREDLEVRPTGTRDVWEARTEGATEWELVDDHHASEGDARAAFEGIYHEEIGELANLESLADECSDYAADWAHGETLIRDSYFQEYAQQMAEDMGAIDRENQWPLNCIDWEMAANDLQVDYTSVDFDGVEYWIR